MLKNGLNVEEYSRPFEIVKRGLMVPRIFTFMDLQGRVLITWVATFHWKQLYSLIGKSWKLQKDMFFNTCIP